MISNHAAVFLRNGIIYANAETGTNTLKMEKGKSKNAGKSRSTLNMRSIFRCMMEEGYYPTFEKTHILFALDDNTAVVEYEENILSIRLFFTIEEEAYELFLEASNEVMLETYAVKPVILSDMKNIMFSVEMICDNIREFRKFFHRGIDLLDEALAMHKLEMKKLILADKISSTTISMAEDISITSEKGRKPLS